MRHICFVPITVTIVLLPSDLLVMPMPVVKNVDVVRVQFSFVKNAGLIERHLSL